MSEHSHPGTGLGQLPRDWINDGLMALFVANLAFSPSLIDSAKPGIFLASVFSAVSGIVLLRAVSGPGKQAQTRRIT